MAIQVQVLGEASRDNAALVRVESGQALHRLLFDCGEACLYSLSVGEVQQIDHLFFSHLHMDHVSGFDTFFRANFNRADRVNHVWGPPGTAECMHHRFRGFVWNLIDGDPATWALHDIQAGQTISWRCELAECFREAHELGAQPQTGAILDHADYRVEPVYLDHGTPCLGYVVREPERVNIDADRLASLGLPPGAWLKAVRGPRAAEEATVSVAGRTLSVRQLQDDLIVRTQGQAVAYLTDFHAEGQEQDAIAERIRGCRVLVCECQYAQADLDLARRNHHMTATLVGELAREAEVDELVLFHLSGRYLPEEWGRLLREARAVFPAARFPEHWHLG